MTPSSIKIYLKYGAFLLALQIVAYIATAFAFGNNIYGIVSEAILGAIYAMIFGYKAVRAVNKLKNPPVKPSLFIDNSPFWQGAWVVFVSEALFSVITLIFFRTFNASGGLLNILFGGWGGRLANTKNENRTRVLIKIFTVIAISSTILIPLGALAYQIFIPLKEFTTYDHFEIAGIAMSPQFKDGQVYRSEKYLYTTNLPLRGDVIVFRNFDSSTPNTHYAKRIIGLPGETIRISNGKVYINNKLLEEPYLNPDGVTDPGTFLEEGKNVIIPENNYVVMGDYRIHSMDSRNKGFIHKVNIIGKLTTCISKCSTGNNK